MKCLIDMNLMNALIHYFIDINKENANEETKDISLMHLRLAHEQYIEDRQENIINYDFNQMTPEISIMIDQRYNKIKGQIPY